MAGTDAIGGVSRKILFSAMKNEAPFILEWIAYHKVIGFDEIVICSNPSNDGLEEILSALADAGEITHLRSVVPQGKPPQIAAVGIFEAQVGYRADAWYLWLDADEFLNVHAGNRTLDALISCLGDRQFALINWRIFGSGGNPVFPGRFISGDFKGASEPDYRSNLELKTLFCFSDAVSGFGKRGMHRPRLSGEPAVTSEQVVVGRGTTASPTSRRHMRWLSGEDLPRAHKIGPEEFGWVHAQINHYIIRTPEFFALKRLRGRGFVANAVGARNTRHTDSFFVENDRNEAEDASILFWEPAVTGEIARLMAIPAVADAKRQSEELVRAILAQMNEEADPMTNDPARPVSGPSPSEDLSAPPASAPFVLTFPEREAEFVRRIYAQASVILEYGSGGSTMLGANLGKTIVSVESDKAWAERLAAELAPFPDAAVHHVDIGPTEKWGMPSRPRLHGRFHRYALSVWDLPGLGDPDLVLIDGRFRAACLAAVLLRARHPTT
ncbi:MAG TPA: glycosyltransferase family 2 protein, partial [Tabrizicola sp.]|nr:glycosyltransferase family 2 protein [Tabrizicola sp.]